MQTSTTTIGDPNDLPLVVEVELIDDHGFLKEQGFDKPDLSIFLRQPSVSDRYEMVVIDGEDIEAFVEAMIVARDQYREALACHEVFS